MRHTAAAVVLAFSAFLAACSDSAVDRNIAPDFPDPMMAKSVGVACTTAQSQLVEDHQDAIFAAGPTLDGAEALWRDVKQLLDHERKPHGFCAGRVHVVHPLYRSQFRDNPAGIIGDKSAPIVAHWNFAFPYVSYAQPGLPSDTLQPSARRVITRSEMAADSVEFGIPSVAAMQTRRRSAAEIHAVICS